MGLSWLQGEGKSWWECRGYQLSLGETKGGGAESASLVLSAVSPWRGGRPGRLLDFRAT